VRFYSVIPFYCRKRTKCAYFHFK